MGAHAEVCAVVGTLPFYASRCLNCLSTILTTCARGEHCAEHMMPPDRGRSGPSPRTPPDGCRSLGEDAF
eukprot:11616250-Alexandrium_andersonii.AAC.1